MIGGSGAVVGADATTYALHAALCAAQAISNPYGPDVLWIPHYACYATWCGAIALEAAGYRRVVGPWVTGRPDKAYDMEIAWQADQLAAMLEAP